MFITYREERSPTGKGRSKFKKIPIMSCDQCGKMYEEPVFKTARTTRKLHFCSRECTDLARKSGGSLNDQWVKNNERLHGSSYNFTGIKRKSSDYSEAYVKAHKTKKENGTYKTSIHEEKIYYLLSELYSSVNRQVNIPGTRWAIDFYVADIDRYIQVDGVYWHGLDRPIEVIAEGKTKQDAVIYRKWSTDRKQDEHFGNRLIRITDKQVISIRTSQELKALIDVL